MRKYIVAACLAAVLAAPVFAQTDDDIMDMINRGSRGREVQTQQPAPRGERRVREEERATCDTSDWETLATEDFRALFPSAPTREKSTVEKVDTLKWVSDSSDPMHLFELSMTKFPRGSIDHNDVDEFLFTAMKSRAQELGSNPVRKRRLDSRRFPGCTFRVECDDSEWDFMIRISGDTVYTLSVCSMPGEGDDGYSDTFFSYMEILR
nr:hypothetical protein [bacterium]